jgi:hypothetical protein
MIAEKDANWVFKICRISDRRCFWWIETKEDIGLINKTRVSEKKFFTRKKAISDFKKYAELNGITKYIIKERKC